MEQTSANQTGTSFHELSDEGTASVSVEFKKKLAQKFYRSTYHQIGELSPAGTHIG